MMRQKIHAMDLLKKCYSTSKDISNSYPANPNYLSQNNNFVNHWQGYSYAGGYTVPNLFFTFTIFVRLCLIKFPRYGWIVGQLHTH